MTYLPLVCNGAVGSPPPAAGPRSHHLCDQLWGSDQQLIYADVFTDVGAVTHHAHPTPMLECSFGSKYENIFTTECRFIKHAAN